MQNIIELLTTQNLLTLALAAAAAYERFGNRKKEKKSEAEQQMVNDAKLHMERAVLLQKLAQDNASLFEEEHKAHQRTRDYWHEKATNFQATLSGCQDKLAEMNQRPDYTEIVEMGRTQLKMGETILKAIQEVVELLKTEIHTRHDK